MLNRNQKKIFKYFSALFVLALFFGNLPQAEASHTSSSAKLEVAGWIPYWASVAGAKDAEKNLDELDLIYPFVYSVKADGTLNDLAQVGKNAADGAQKSAWQSLFKRARKENVKIVPTVMWSNGADMERILSDKNLRKAHIKAIMSMMKTEKFDGVNIDYEGKLAATRDDFSIFLKELKKELGKKKMLTCSIEPRTPPESLYRVVPATLEYSNDFKEIGKHCDRVEIMAYDQRRADFVLNDAKSGTPYIPVADADWVKKVAELAKKDIPKKKLLLGVATYGAEFDVTVAPNHFQNYMKLRSVNPPQALATASANQAVPSRNKAGEMSFSYLMNTPGGAVPGTFPAMLSSLAVPAGTPSGDILAQKALAYANQTGRTVNFSLVWWSDAEAIGDKLDLARELGLKGVAIFKIDGEEDPKLWETLKGN